MSNMFSEKSEKQIPKTLADCTAQDETATNLHLWAEQLEIWGSFLFKALVVIGIISTVADAINTAAISDRVEMVVIACISSVITWALYAFIEYCAYHVLALLISALASITQNTIISANVALYEAYQNSAQTVVPCNTKTDGSTQAVHATIPSADTWKCKNCGTSNSTNYSQCKKCGQYKS